ncbi:12 TM domain-containing transmembrane protein [Acrasis kona]|uniref:UNC93-like protein MFSD11 n=1 Tax=Acrasis kona TaxID=1008807 RepID=A0AAW2YHG1_9EUKA
MSESDPIIQKYAVEEVGASGHKSRSKYLSRDLSFMTIFTSFNTTQGTMTTFHEKAGFWSLCVLYAFFAFTNLISAVIVKKLGARLSLFIGAAPYAAFVLTAAFNSDVALIIVGAFVGIGAAILWSFLSFNAGEDMGFYSGLFFGIFQINGILGNVLTGALLNAGISQFYIFSILFVISVLGLILMCYLVDPRPSAALNNQEKNTDSMSHMIKETVKVILTDKRMVFFHPISLYSGFSNSLFLGLLPPRVGLAYLGWVLAVLGLAEVIGSLVFGKLADIIGTWPVMIVTLVTHAITLGLSFFFDVAEPYLWFVTMFFAGLADAGLNTSIYAILGSPNYFKLQPAYAFSGFKLVQSIAMAAGFLCGIYVPFTYIQYAVCLMWVGAVVFFALSDAIIPSDYNRTTIN